jgi:L-lactate dehydrogenase complex protein LldG
MLGRRHPTPSRVAGKSPAEHLALFKQHMLSQSATVLEAATAADVPSLIAGYLRQNNLAARLATGDDAYLAALPWSTEPTLERKQGRATPSDEVGLSHATAAIAETGTLMMASGADNPVTINFLPETHIVVVEEKDMVGPYEDGWNKIRARFGSPTMPRTVNMISGPSRTGDIGGRLVMGAHGPRRMCVVLVKG